MRAAFWQNTNTNTIQTRDEGAAQTKRCCAVMLSRCAIVPVIVNAFFDQARYPVAQVEAHARALTSNGLYCYARF